MKGMKLVISLAVALVTVAAAICAVVIFQEEIAKAYGSCKAFCCKTLRIGTNETEFDDFADV